MIINYEYWNLYLYTKEKIAQHERLMIDNIDKYIDTKDNDYLEYLEENIKEIRRLKPLVEEYYQKAIV